MQNPFTHTHDQPWTLPYPILPPVPLPATGTLYAHLRPLYTLPYPIPPTSTSCDDVESLYDDPQPLYTNLLVNTGEFRARR